MSDVHRTVSCALFREKKGLVTRRGRRVIERRVPVPVGRGARLGVGALGRARLRERRARALLRGAPWTLASGPRRPRRQPPRGSPAPSRARVGVVLAHPRGARGLSAGERDGVSRVLTRVRTHHPEMGRRDGGASDGAARKGGGCQRSARTRGRGEGGGERDVREGMNGTGRRDGAASTRVKKPRARTLSGGTAACDRAPRTRRTALSASRRRRRRRRRRRSSRSRPTGASASACPDGQRFPPRSIR